MFIHTLNNKTGKLLKKLGSTKILEHFYLAGGSAAALYLGHRISVYLDFFTLQESINQEILLNDIQRLGKLTLSQQGKGTLVGTINDVQVSFFTYPYPLLDRTCKLFNITIAGLMDIALMKIIAISQRGKMRDFIDLFFICKRNFNLRYLIKILSKKYPGINYSSYHIIRALSFFQDAEKDVPPKALEKWDWKKIKLFFEKETKEIMEQLK